MKSMLIAALALAGAVSAKAQVRNLPNDEITVVQEQTNDIVVPGFWSNWFIGAGAGFQTYFGDHNRDMKFGETLSPNYTAYAGKWFTPGIGARLGVSGFKIKGLTQEGGAHSTGERYDGKPWDGYWLEKQEFNYFHLHGDILFNLMNLIGGYRADRFYEVSPYAGLGWMVTNDAPKAKEVSASVGFFNSFRLNNAFNVTFDVRGSMVNDRFDGDIGGRKQEGALTAAVGVVYKFPKRDWKNGTQTVVNYNEQFLNDMRDKVALLAQDNDALRQQLLNAKSETITEIKVEQRLLAAPVLLTFEISKSELSREARVNLGFFAKVIKEGDENAVYKIIGYADKGTGNKQLNDRLSLARAKAVFQVLTQEYHVPENRLKVFGEGGVDNMYYDDPRLSRAVVTIAE